MPIVVLLFCRSHCPRLRRCLKLPNEQPECRHIELFPLKEHLSSLHQCKVFVVETLQDTHLLIHGSMLVPELVSDLSMSAHVTASSRSSNNRLLSLSICSN